MIPAKLMRNVTLFWIPLTKGIEGQEMDNNDDLSCFLLFRMTLGTRRRQKPCVPERKRTGPSLQMAKKKTEIEKKIIKNNI